MKKSYVLFTLFITLGCLSVRSQVSPVENYLNTAKEFAAIYSGGELDYYSTVIYENFPYYKQDDYLQGNLWTTDNYYPNLKLKLDLYKEQLIALTPNSNLGVIFLSSLVEKFTLEDELFIYISDNPYNLRKGYYKQLHEGELFTLYKKDRYLLNRPSNKVTQDFYLNSTFYLIKEGKAFPIKRKGSFTKLFPQFKKQIKKHIKENQLSWRHDTEHTLTELVDLCEILSKTENL